MSAHHLSELLSPYRTFDATTPLEVRAAISRQSTPGPIGRHIAALVEAQRVSALDDLINGVTAA